MNLNRCLWQVIVTSNGACSFAIKTQEASLGIGMPHQTTSPRMISTPPSAPITEAGLPPIGSTARVARGALRTAFTPGHSRRTNGLRFLAPACITSMYKSVRVTTHHARSTLPAMENPHGGRVQTKKHTRHMFCASGKKSMVRARVPRTEVTVFRISGGSGSGSGSDSGGSGSNGSGSSGGSHCDRPRSL